MQTNNSPAVPKLLYCNMLVLKPRYIKDYLFYVKHKKNIVRKLVAKEASKVLTHLSLTLDG